MVAAHFFDFIPIWALLIGTILITILFIEQWVTGRTGTSRGFK